MSVRILGRITIGRPSFQQMFGFRTYPSAAEAEQAIVDLELTERAKMAQIRFKSQEELAKASKGDTLPRQRDRLREDLVRVGEQVARSKARFWRAHRLARKAGYQVRRRISDYLPSS